LIQDIVVNHTGDFFAYQGGWNPANPAQYWVRNTGSVPVTAPTQPPFNMDDPTDPAQQAAAIYHWTPDISNFNDENQLLNYQLFGLDDLNTENPVVRTALRSSYGYWIKTIGVDAFRIDTAFYVPQAFFSDFMYSNDPAAPGILAVAQSTGRTAFHAFGEGQGIDQAYQDTVSQKIESYMVDPGGNDILPGMINYPLYGTMIDVLESGHPTGELAYRIDDMMQVYKRPWLMATFLDNHDVPRFLAGGSVAALKQGLVLLMTLPGIPVIYYGTEQGFTQQRGSMFAAGFGSGGVDHFDTSAPLYQFIAQLSALRKQNKVFSHGTPTILQQNSATPGVLVWKMTWGGANAIAAINTSDSDTMPANFATGLPAGTVLTSEVATGASGAALIVAANGTAAVSLPPRSACVWLAGSASQ
ncbi:MAG TPA: alpha-amylase family glycosyl hydrolase, partial [Paraburkholderia sp.]|nr:alpha-amylase family glycosyl hydrolase [Paraburkholderia sp.]